MGIPRMYVCVCVFGTNVARETGIPDVHDSGSVREAAIVGQIASRVQSEASFRRMGENRNVFVERGKKASAFWSFLLRACVGLIPYATLIRAAARFAMSKGKIERPGARRVPVLDSTGCNPFASCDRAQSRYSAADMSNEPSLQQQAQCEIRAFPLSPHFRSSIRVSKGSFAPFHDY